MKVKPLADRVLVKPAEAEQKTASGIIIPDTAKEKPMTGEVLLFQTQHRKKPSRLLLRLLDRELRRKKSL